MDESESDREARRERLRQFLVEMAIIGLTQQAVAARAGVPSQYLSDVKNGRRLLSELLARRLNEEFGVDHVWLMTGEGTMTPPRVPRAETRPQDAEVVMVPIVGQPIVGDPRISLAWDGSLVALTGPPAMKAKQASHAYILRLHHDDFTGRLRKGDLVLISQGNLEFGEIQVIQTRGLPVLARRGKGGAIIPLKNGKAIAAGATVLGTCVCIVWAAL